MYTSKVSTGAKSAGVVAVAALMTMSVGSAAASTPPVTDGSAAVVNATTVQASTNSFTARFEPAQLRQQPRKVQSTLVAPPAGVVANAARSGARPSKAFQQAKFTVFTTRSAKTKDVRGVEPSLYRGRYYRTAVEGVRLCIVKRESEGHYDVVNPSGSYRGAYQVSAELARGATWMMLKEHRALMGESNAKRVLADLRRKPINQWPRYWQDALFSTVANWDHTGSGLRHWAGGRWHC